MAVHYPSLVAYVQKKILKRLYELGDFENDEPDNDKKGRRLMEQYNLVSDKEDSRRFFILNLECLRLWASENKTDPEEAEQKSKYLKYYEALVEHGVMFPQRNTFLDYLSQKPVVSQLESRNEGRMEKEDEMSEEEYGHLASLTLGELKEARVKMYRELIGEGAVTAEDMYKARDEMGKVFKNRKRVISAMKGEDAKGLEVERKWVMDIGSILIDAGEDEDQMKRIVQEKVRELWRRNGWVEEKRREVIQEVEGEDEGTGKEASSERRDRGEPEEGSLEVRNEGEEKNQLGSEVRKSEGGDEFFDKGWSERSSQKQDKEINWSFDSRKDRKEDTDYKKASQVERPVEKATHSNHRNKNLNDKSGQELNNSSNQKPHSKIRIPSKRSSRLSLADNINLNSSNFGEKSVLSSNEKKVWGEPLKEKSRIENQRKTKKENQSEHSRDQIPEDQQFFNDSKEIKVEDMKKDFRFTSRSVSDIDGHEESREPADINLDDFEDASRSNAGGSRSIEHDQSQEKSNKSFVDPFEKLQAEKSRSNGPNSELEEGGKGLSNVQNLNFSRHSKEPKKDAERKTKKQAEVIDARSREFAGGFLDSSHNNQSQVLNSSRSKPNMIGESQIKVKVDSHPFAQLFQDNMSPPKSSLALRTSLCRSTSKEVRKGGSVHFGRRNRWGNTDVKESVVVKGSHSLTNEPNKKLGTLPTTLVHSKPSVLVKSEITPKERSVEIIENQGEGPLKEKVQPEKKNLIVSSNEDPWSKPNEDTQKEKPSQNFIDFFGSELKEVHKMSLDNKEDQFQDGGGVGGNDPFRDNDHISNRGHEKEKVDPSPKNWFEIEETPKYSHQQDKETHHAHKDEERVEEDINPNKSSSKIQDLSEDRSLPKSGAAFGLDDFEDASLSQEGGSHKNSSRSQDIPQIPSNVEARPLGTDKRLNKSDLSESKVRVSRVLDELNMRESDYMISNQNKDAVSAEKRRTESNLWEINHLQEVDSQLNFNPDDFHYLGEAASPLKEDFCNSARSMNITPTKAPPKTTIDKQTSISVEVVLKKSLGVQVNTIEEDLKNQFEEIELKVLNGMRGDLEMIERMKQDIGRREGEVEVREEEVREREERCEERNNMEVWSVGLSAKSFQEDGEIGTRGITEIERNEREEDAASRRKLDEDQGLLYQREMLLNQKMKEFEEEKEDFYHHQQEKIRLISMKSIGLETSILFSKETDVLREEMSGIVENRDHENNVLEKVKKGQNEEGEKVIQKMAQLEKQIEVNKIEYDNLQLEKSLFEKEKINFEQNKKKYEEKNLQNQIESKEEKHSIQKNTIHQTEAAELKKENHEQMQIAELKKEREKRIKTEVEKEGLEIELAETLDQLEQTKIELNKFERSLKSSEQENLANLKMLYESQGEANTLKSKLNDFISKYTALLKSKEEAEMKEKEMRIRLEELHSIIGKSGNTLKENKMSNESDDTTLEALRLEKAESKMRELVKENIDLKTQVLETNINYDVKKDLIACEERVLEQVKTSNKQLTDEVESLKATNELLEKELEESRSVLRNQNQMIKDIEIVRTIAMVSGEDGKIAWETLRGLIRWEVAKEPLENEIAMRWLGEKLGIERIRSGGDKKKVRDNSVVEQVTIEPNHHVKKIDEEQVKASNDMKMGFSVNLKSKSENDVMKDTTPRKPKSVSFAQNEASPRSAITAQPGLIQPSDLNKMGEEVFEFEENRLKGKESFPPIPKNRLQIEIPHSEESEKEKNKYRIHQTHLSFGKVAPQSSPKADSDSVSHKTFKSKKSKSASSYNLVDYISLLTPKIKTMRLPTLDLLRVSLSSQDSDTRIEESFYKIVQMPKYQEVGDSSGFYVWIIIAVDSRWKISSSTKKEDNFGVEVSVLEKVEQEGLSQESKNVLNQLGNSLQLLKVTSKVPALELSIPLEVLAEKGSEKSEDNEKETEKEPKSHNQKEITKILETETFFRLSIPVCPLNFLTFKEGSVQEFVEQYSQEGLKELCTSAYSSKASRVMGKTISPRKDIELHP